MRISEEAIEEITNKPCDILQQMDIEFENFLGTKTIGNKKGKNKCNQTWAWPL